jgi:hypothetical protein
VLEWVPWQDSVEVAAATAAIWSFSGRLGAAKAWVRKLRPWAQELTLILVLYSLWQYAGAWSIGRIGAALTRGRDIWDVERVLHLPNERTFQRLFLDQRGLLHFLNEFYAAVHAPALGLGLVWMFVRHRERYPVFRTAVALITGAGLLIQMFPVAPPRLVPYTGMVDTAALIGPSVYTSGAPGIDQLSAMPSLHVGWALVVAWGVVWAGRGWWRWLALAYPAMTIFTVTVTGNHYWADSIVAAIICAAALAVVWRVYRPPGRAIRLVAATPVEERLAQPTPLG